LRQQLRYWCDEQQHRFSVPVLAHVNAHRHHPHHRSRGRTANLADWPAIENFHFPPSSFALIADTEVSAKVTPFFRIQTNAAIFLAQ
jgi:hypothetical protein